MTDAKRKSIVVLGGVLMVLLMGIVSQPAVAHSRWIVPSHTILSGEAVFVSLDFSISNQIFHADIAYGGQVPESAAEEGAAAALAGKLKDYPVQGNTLRVTFPDGTTDDSLPVVNLGRKSSSALWLSESGTYRIGVRRKPVVITTFRNADGSPGRLFGPPGQELPEGATGGKVLKLHPRVETYVTRNGPTREALKPVGEGLELTGETHPNDLFAGERDRFRLVLNGESVKEGVEVKFTRGGTRHRNTRNTQVVKTGDDGRFTVPWKQAGLYLLEAEVEVESDAGAIDADVYSLFVTLEVNPE